MGVIFDTNNSRSNYTPVAESKYGCDLNAALMHIYENEVNYTAMMKSVGLAEFKYCTENAGKDLFLNEAGAFSGFLAKVKAFFKKVIEKIKALFHAFMAKINSFVMSDKDFLKKYGAEVRRKNIKDLEFTGYTNLFNISEFDTNIKTDTVKSAEEVAKRINEDFSKDTADHTYDRNELIEDINRKVGEKRGELAGKPATDLDESEFREELHDKLYGDKEKFDVTSNHVTSALSFIEDASKLIKSAEKVRNAITKDIDEFIKEIEKVDRKTPDKEIGATYKKTKTGATDKEVSDAVELAHKIVGVKIDVAKGYSNAYTTYFGALIGAFKDANRQAKALCVKVISYKVKNESATAYAESGVPFADVKLV